MSTQPSLNLDEKTLELLKQKNPSKYKAISIASLIYFKEEKDFLEFIEETTDYIDYLASTITKDKATPTLKYEVPEGSTTLDSISKSLIKDILEEDLDPAMTTARLKNLTNITLTNLKESGFVWQEYSGEDKDRYIESCIGYFDQLMLCKEISILADKNK